MLRGLFSLIILFFIGVFTLSIVSPHLYGIFAEKTTVFRTRAETFITQTITRESPIDLNKKEGETPPGFTIAALIAATNKARHENGLPPLTDNPKLDRSAQIKTNDMISQQYFEHTSPNGKTVSDLGTAVGYNYIVMGENLALGDFSTVDELLAAWMASPGHRANILNKNYEEIGVDASYGMYDGRIQLFAVQHFGTPKIVCPTITNGLIEQITTLTATLNAQQKAIEESRAKVLSESETSPTYQSDVIAFNQKVDAYNKIIMLQKEKIATYNKEVSAFNSCLSKFQK